MISQKILFTLLIVTIVTACTEKESMVGQTEIAKWQYGKKSAISLTYDDGTINQFRVALPIMNRLEFPATFFIITGNIPGSAYAGKFIGRPVQEIIKETAQSPTNQENFFERASAIGFLGYQGTLEYHTQAGQLYEQEKIEEAYQLIDEAYAKVRNGEFTPVKKRVGEVSNDNRITWEEIKTFAAQGHEFGSHTVTHPRLAALDEVNMLYELEKSKEDILEQLGPEYTFSAECPYGTEDERVMEYAYEIYPALRNRMPEPYLEEINRWSEMTPGVSDKPYVQWQRGPLTATPMDLMKSWVDTLITHDNVWLALTFHGVDGIGWEAKPHEELEEYFQYMKEREDQLWVATFQDVTKYMRERMSAEVQAGEEEDQVVVTLTHSLDKTMYDIPLTLKTYVPSEWKIVHVKQGDQEGQINPEQDERGVYVMYQALPNAGSVVLSEV